MMPALADGLIWTLEVKDYIPPQYVLLQSVQSLEQYSRKYLMPLI